MHCHNRLPDASIAGGPSDCLRDGSEGFCVQNERQRREGKKNRRKRRKEKGEEEEVEERRGPHLGDGSEGPLLLFWGSH